MRFTSSFLGCRVGTITLCSFCLLFFCGCWKRKLLIDLCCRVYEKVGQPLRLEPGNDYYLFKEGIIPQWDHPKNRDGGCWVVDITPRENLLNFYWLELLLSLILHRFGDYNDDVCGAVVRIRKDGRKVCSLWTLVGSLIVNFTEFSQCPSVLNESGTKRRPDRNANMRMSGEGQ